MMLPLARLLVRVWTRAITWGLSPDERDRRREEIESDLWEFEHDSNRGGDMASGFRVLARLILGMPHDVAWRMDHAMIRRLALRSAIGLATMAAIAAMLIGQALRPPSLPSVKPAPPPEILTLRKRLPPVPPPPPPRREGVREPDWAGLLMQIHRERALEEAEATAR